MSLYRRISVRMWGDAKFRSLTAPTPNAQSLWLYLLTGEYTTAIPGVVRAGEAALAESLGWPLSAFRKAFEEIYAKGMAYPDWSGRLVFLPKALQHNPPQSPKVVIAWRNAFEDLADCRLKVEIGRSIKGYLEDKPKAFQEAFDIVLAEDESEASQKAFMVGIPIQDQKQNRNKKQNIETENSDRSQARSKISDWQIWFEQEFKPAYPIHRQVQEKTAIAKLREIKPGPDDRTAIVARLEKWKASTAWTKDGGEYVPGMGKFFADGWFQRDPAEPVFGRNGSAPVLTSAEEYLSRTT